jgi:hypothetical protein
LTRTGSDACLATQRRLTLSFVLYRCTWRDEHRVFDGLTYDAVVKAMGVKR